MLLMLSILIFTSLSNMFLKIYNMPGISSNIKHLGISHNTIITTEPEFPNTGHRGKGINVNFIHKY